MIDIHSHVLYGIDDGATTIEMSLDMLRSYVAQGVTHVFCTSHSRSAMHRYENHFRHLQLCIADEQIPITILKGCEVECSEEEMPEIIDKLNSGFYPTLNGTRCILVEFDPYASEETILSCIRYILHHSHYKPILAHVERYKAIYDSQNLLLRLGSMGCLFQMNLHSLVETKNTELKAFARELLEGETIDLFGSDAHRTDYRPPAVESGLAYAKETCPWEYYDVISSEHAAFWLVDKVWPTYWKE